MDGRRRRSLARRRRPVVHDARLRRAPRDNRRDARRGRVGCGVGLALAATLCRRRRSGRRPILPLARFDYVLSSFLAAGRQEGYYALQAEQTHASVEPLDPRQIRYQPPRRGLLLAACLVAIAVPLGMRGPSERVLSEQQLAHDTALATAAINKELAKLVDELQQESPTADEKELLKPNQLREWVKKLEETGDHKEALRQYAQLERKLNEFRRTLQNKRDEQLLERAARELQSSRETQPLAEQLKQKKYDRSAEELQKMRPASDKPLSKQRRELARLKAAAQHMAAAARAARSASKSSANSSASEGGSGAGSGGSGSGGGGDLAQMMQDLAEAVDNLDDSLEEGLRQEAQTGECDAKQLSQCKSCSECVASQLSKLSKRLKKLAVCKKCEARLCKLCQACSQCQGNLSCMCNSPNAGGKKAGMGTNSARRNQRDELLDNGQTTALKGIKGHGPSITTVEAANEGSGVSSRRAARRQDVRAAIRIVRRPGGHPRRGQGRRQAILSSHSPAAARTDPPGDPGRCRPRNMRPAKRSSASSRLSTASAMKSASSSSANTTSSSMCCWPW